MTRLRLAGVVLGSLLAVPACSGRIGDVDERRPADAFEDGEDEDGGLGQDGEDDVGSTSQGLGVRQLRLLTRREYDRTIDDLFAFGTSAGDDGAACDTLADCAVREESCVGGVCTADPCGLETFLLDAPSGSLGEVVVAGDFNGWGATEAAGGWAMPYDAEIGGHVLKRAVGPGRHLYKLVIDGATWITDPAASETEPDGFGGTNGVLSVTCDAGEPPTSDGATADPWSKSFPDESRPHGFPFDDHAASGLVTRVHAEQYLRASAAIAARATQDLAARIGCEPTTASDPCIESFLEDFGRRAYRRPLSDDERARLVAIASGAPDAESGVQRALRVMLSSPWFLYRSEIGEDGGDGVAELSPWEKATALAYGLWGSPPDDVLLDAAATGALDSEDDLEREARRMLSDARAETQLGVFGVQWLGVEDLAQTTKAASASAWSTELAAAMTEETRRLVARVATGKAPFEDLFLAGRTDAIGPLATFYGAAEDGTVPPSRRAGILAHGSVLAAYAHSDQSSPVRRGLFVRQRLLCQELGTPPANAGAVPEVDPDVSTRERFSQHSVDPACEGCHRLIDPVGFGFEGFDAIGAERSQDAGQPIDDGGIVHDLEAIGDGTSDAFRGLPALGAMLAESTAARTCFVRQMNRFVSGRMETEEDAGTLHHLEAAFGDEGDVPALLVAMVRSRAFSMRRVP